MNASALRRIGFDENEIKVYTELLKTEEAAASEIAGMCGVNRTFAYQILGKLIEKGLVSYVIKNNVKWFKASDPSRLLAYIKERESEIRDLVRSLGTIEKTAKKSYSTEIYEGKEGLKTIMEDILISKPSEWLDFTSGATTMLMPLHIDKWERRRAKAKIKARILINRTDEGMRRAKGLRKFPLTAVRFLPEGLKTPVHFYVYGNKTALALWSGEESFGILIKSKKIADRFREFFEWFWSMAKK